MASRRVLQNQRIRSICATITQRIQADIHDHNKAISCVGKLMGDRSLDDVIGDDLEGNILSKYF
jgi:hypothetical protein